MVNYFFDGVNPLWLQHSLCTMFRVCLIDSSCMIISAAFLEGWRQATVASKCNFEHFEPLAPLAWAILIIFWCWLGGFWRVGILNSWSPAWATSKRDRHSKDFKRIIAVHPATSLLSTATPKTLAKSKLVRGHLPAAPHLLVLSLRLGLRSLSLFVITVITVITITVLVSWKIAESNGLFSSQFFSPARQRINHFTPRHHHLI